jgi:hypothetical protein
MVRFISLLIIAGVLVARIQQYDGKEPVHFALPKEKIVKADYKQKRDQIKPEKQPEIARQTGKLRNELVNRLRSAKVNKSASQLIVDAIIEVNDPVASSFPVDESVYDQQGEMEQPLEALNELDMEQKLELAGLNAEQNQVIIDGIAEANFDNR